ncbi:MAG: MFS transporter [Rhodospirillales bacterium]|nr:MFS transporter [Rhodospirillales bacterium]
MSETVRPARTLSGKTTISIFLIAVLGVGVVIGMTFPLVTLSLERMDLGATLIGLNSATASLGILVVGLISARLLARFSTSLVIIASCFLSVASLVLLPIVGTVAGWFILRFMMTLGLGFLWLICETWLNAVAIPSNRGQIMGLYGAAFSGGFALGPLVITLTGSQGWFPFALAGGILAASSMPMLLLGGFREGKGDEHVGQFKIFRLHPFVFIVAFAAGLFETTAYALLPVYTLGEGLGENGSMYALSAFSAGGIAFQYPMGKLADAVGRNALLILTALSILIGVVVLPFVINMPVILFFVLFLLGGSIFGLYTLGLILLGDGFNMKNLIAANAVFIITYEAGAVFGPALSGSAMDLWPDNGFVGFLLFCAVVFAGLAVKKAKQSSP